MSVCVQKAFHRLKVSRVPNWSMMSYGGLCCRETRVCIPQAALANTSFLLLSEIIDFLQAEVVPCLEEQLKKLSWEETKQEEQQEPMYLLSDIYPQYDFTEVDNSV